MVVKDVLGMVPVHGPALLHTVAVHDSTSVNTVIDVRERVERLKLATTVWAEVGADGAKETRIARGDTYTDVVGHVGVTEVRGLTGWDTVHCPLVSMQTSKQVPDAPTRPYV